MEAFPERARVVPQRSGPGGRRPVVVKIPRAFGPLTHRCLYGPEPQLSQRPDEEGYLVGQANVLAQPGGDKILHVLALW